jgi:hypothetical protein
MPPLPSEIPNTFWKLSKVGVKANSFGGRLKMSLPCLNATDVQ